MAQAKTLTKTELKRVIDVTNSCSRYAARDVTMLLLTHLCGLRIGEVANLRIDDVIDTDGTEQTEIRLDAKRTKNNHARTAQFFVLYTKEPAVQCKYRNTALTTLVCTCCNTGCYLTQWQTHLANNAESKRGKCESAGGDGWT